MDELDALALQAGQIDGEAGAMEPAALVEDAQAAEMASLGEKNSQALSMMLDLAGGTFAVVGFPSVGAVFTPEKKAALAGVWGPVFTKYGVDISSGLEGYGEEIAAVVVTFPIAIAVWAGIKSDAAARAAGPGKPAQVAAGPAPGSVDWRPEPEADAQG